MQTNHSAYIPGRPAPDNSTRRALRRNAAKAYREAMQPGVPKGCIPVFDADEDPVSDLLCTLSDIADVERARVAFLTDAADEFDAFE